MSIAPNPGRTKRLLAFAFALMLAAPASAAPVLDKDVLGSGGDFVSGGGLTLGMTVGETAVGLAFPAVGAFAEVAGFWGPGASPIVGVGDRPRLASVDRLAFEVVPNPFGSSLSIRLALPAGTAAASARAAIFDTRGRLVRALGPAERAGEGHTMTWDGRDQDGRELPGGIYFCRVEVGALTVTRRLARVR